MGCGVLILIVDHPSQGRKELGRLAQRRKGKLFIPETTVDDNYGEVNVPSELIL